MCPAPSQPICEPNSVFEQNELTTPRPSTQVAVRIAHREEFSIAVPSADVSQSRRSPPSWRFLEERSEPAILCSFGRSARNHIHQKRLQKVQVAVDRQIPAVCRRILNECYFIQFAVDMELLRLLALLSVQEEAATASQGVL